MSKRKRPRTGVPPSLEESPANLAAEAAAAEAGAAGDGDKPPKRKRGRPTKEEAAAAAAADAVPFPVEALAILHFELWRMVAASMRSRYQLSEEGAREMAAYAEVCIRQYVGPSLAEHTPLAAYLMTQGAAVMACFALRQVPGELAPGARRVEEAPGGPAPPPQYHMPPTAEELGAGGAPHGA